MMATAGMSLFGQQAITGLEPRAVQGQQPTSSNKITAVDTITTYLDRATAYYLLTAGANGYVLGTGITSETAEHYDGLGATTVTEVLAYFAKKVVVGQADSLIAHAYAAAPDSSAGLPIGSGTFSVADIDTSGFPTIIPLTGTAPTLGDFVISVQYAGVGIDDSVAITSSNPVSQGGGPDGNNERRCRQNTISAGWMAAADIWTIQGLPYNADAMLIPIVDFTAVGVDAHIGKAGFNLYPSYPSPTSGLHNVAFSTDATADVTLTVYDRTGRTVLATTERQVAPGKHTLALDGSAWAAGTYYYVLSNGSHSLGSKFAVVH